MDRDDVINLLCAILPGTVPLPGAACQGRSELFDDDPSEEPDDREYRLNAALRILQFVDHAALPAGRGLYRWQRGQLQRLDDTPERAEVAANSAGQTATSTGALALWISSLTDPDQPARYLMDLIDLGRLGQRVCLVGAELGIGVFLTLRCMTAGPAHFSA